MRALDFFQSILLFAALAVAKPQEESPAASTSMVALETRTVTPLIPDTEVSLSAVSLTAAATITANTSSLRSLSGSTIIVTEPEFVTPTITPGPPLPTSGLDAQRIGWVPLTTVNDGETTQFYSPILCGDGSMYVTSSYAAICCNTTGPSGIATCLDKQLPLSCVGNVMLADGSTVSACGGGQMCATRKVLEQQHGGASATASITAVDSVSLHYCEADDGELTPEEDGDIFRNLPAVDLLTVGVNQSVTAAATGTQQSQSSGVSLLVSWWTLGVAMVLGQML